MFRRNTLLCPRGLDRMKCRLFSATKKQWGNRRKRPLFHFRPSSVVNDIIFRPAFDSSNHFRYFHTSIPSFNIFDPLQSPLSSTLLKQRDDTDLSAQEKELKECLEDYMQQSYSPDPDLLDSLHNAYMALEYWEEALKVEETKFLLYLQNSSNTDTQADSIHTQGKLWLRQGNFEKSLTLYQQAIDHFRDSKNLVQEGHALISLAGWHYFQFEQKENPTFLKTALEHLQQAESMLDTNPALLVKCLDNQGLVYRLMNDYESALDKYQQGLQVVVDSQTRRALQMHVADMHVALQDPYQALSLYQELLHECQQQEKSKVPGQQSTYDEGDTTGKQGVLWHNIASLYVQLGDADQAEVGFREALRLKEESAGRDDHPELAKTWNALGALYLGVLDEKHSALECFRHVLWIIRTHSPYDDPRSDPEVLLCLQTISDIEEQIDRERVRQRK